MSRDSRYREDRYETDSEPTSSASQLLLLLSIAAWGLLMTCTLFGGCAFIVALSKTASAPQEAALGAVFATIFIALYILARCVEKIGGFIERMRGKQDRE